jgi:hypothetical protein
VCALYWPTRPLLLPSSFLPDAPSPTPISSSGRQISKQDIYCSGMFSSWSEGLACKHHPQIEAVHGLPIPCAHFMCVKLRNASRNACKQLCLRPRQATSGAPRQNLVCLLKNATLLWRWCLYFNTASLLGEAQNLPHKTAQTLQGTAYSLLA